MRRTVAFVKQSANVFFHILTQCNLKCAHCYINPAQHGTRHLSLETIEAWLRAFIRRSPGANLILLGGEPTLHPDLADAVKIARRLRYASVTIDTNGYLFNDILNRVSPRDVDMFSFSLDGPTPEINDAQRGAGCFATCTAGLHAAKARGFGISLIYTVSSRNLMHLAKMTPLLADWGVDHLFIQVIGLRGHSAAGRGAGPSLQVTREEWQRTVPAVAQAVAAEGIRVTYPKVYLRADDSFECAGRAADNYFIFPNGRVYRCPLCEDFPLHALEIEAGVIAARPPLNESNLFQLEIAEGCVMNRLIQPYNLAYHADGTPLYKVACCLLKEQLI